MGLNSAFQTGNPLSGAMVLLEQHSASGSSSLDFTNWYNALYDEYIIEFVNLVPATDQTSIAIYFSTNGGSSYDSTSGHYAAYEQYFYSGGHGVNTLATTGIQVAGIVSNASTYGFVGSYKLMSPASTTLYKALFGTGFDFQSDAANTLVRHEVMAHYKSTTAINAFRVQAGSGNLTSGTVRIYGLIKSFDFQGPVFPMTTKGDLVAYGTAPARLAVGSDGQALIADSSQTQGVKWASQGAIIGTATFSASGGTISNTVYRGVISSVTRVSTGRYTVNISPSQSQFAAMLNCSDDNTAARHAYLSGTPNFNSSLSSFDFYVYADGIGVQDCNSLSVVLVKL